VRAIFALVAMVAITSSEAFADCIPPATGTQSVPLLSPPLSMAVTGTGRLPFHSAPKADCVMPGIFVIPKDELIAYAQSANGWSSVMYLNPKTGADVSGWVRSSRLKKIGTMGR
jgi:hypothetical protein